MCIVLPLRRVIQTALVFSLLAYYVSLTERRQGQKLDSRTQWTGTYTSNRAEEYSELGFETPWPPDTTVVILNWSRLPNVIHLARIMCSSLQDTVMEVFVWNNNPTALTQEDFAESQCPGHMLRIYNSPQNVYFQARFLACAQAQTPYCFIQDDDYFIQPSIIRTMRARMTEADSSSLHLLPSHEMLYSRSSTIRIKPAVHTLFAWLGYGTMVKRPAVQDFMELLREVDANEDVLKMADNYFTVLSNRLPELWFDQNHELGGGTPFTVGAAGEERNNRHIINAGHILDSLALQPNHSIGLGYPYMSVPTPPILSEAVSKAVCSGVPCVMETNIKLLQKPLEDSVSSATEIITHIVSQFDSLGIHAIQDYLRCSPSFAVDADPQTNFCSATHAKEGDWISLNWMMPREDELEFVLLVNHSTEEILKSSRFEISGDGKSWVLNRQVLKCSTAEKGKLRECSIALNKNSPRMARVVLERDVSYGWTVHEIWLRRKFV